MRTSLKSAQKAAIQPSLTFTTILGMRLSPLTPNNNNVKYKLSFQQQEKKSISQSECIIPRTSAESLKSTVKAPKSKVGNSRTYTPGSQAKVSEKSYT